MITKFNCKGTGKTIEFSRESSSVLVCVTEDDNQIDLNLSKDNLFSLIGQLLRIQSEIREGGQNGN
tara:strand:+ start:166 stop:363 length:198 start_codon:yes stop_codon:yes gene_type:complete